MVDVCVCFVVVFVCLFFWGGVCLILSEYISIFSKLKTSECLWETCTQPHSAPSNEVVSVKGHKPCDQLADVNFITVLSLRPRLHCDNPFILQNLGQLFRISVFQVALNLRYNSEFSVYVFEATTPTAPE